MSAIIIFKEKHGERIFDASTYASKCNACLQIFNERYKEGYWYDKPEDLGEAPTQPDITREQANGMQDQTLKASILKRWTDYERQLKQHTEDLKSAKAAQEIYEDQDAVRAYNYLKSRADYEYEGFEEESTEVAKNKIRNLFAVRHTYKDKQGNYVRGWIAVDVAGCPSEKEVRESLTEDISKARLYSAFEQAKECADELRKRFKADRYSYNPFGLSIKSMREAGLIKE